MPGGVVCYLERAGGGSSIRRIRLVAAGLSRVWTAPEASTVSSIEGGAGQAVGAAHAGAKWVAQTLAGLGLKRLAAVCADSDGSVCAWLSAPGPEGQIIRAAISQSSGEADGTGAGVGAARLLAISANPDSPGVTTDVSLQALATLEEPEGAATESRGLRSRFRRSSESPATGKTRYAVLAIPDAPVRVLLDALDRDGVECEAVMSLWHAMAAAWNPQARRGAGAHVVSVDAPPTAVVLIEPTGRLVWAWTLSGELITGGTMRLATFSKPVEAGAAGATPSDALASPAQGDSARRLAAQDAPAESPTTVEFSQAEAGRLVMDWLSWSAQLGQCPQRVVCLTCPTLVSSDGGGPESVARLLACVWPNATIDGAVHDDPVGATISRLAGLGADNEPPPETDSQLPAALRPRAALVGLSSRPGRADRSLHVWIAATLVAIAGVVGAAAFKVYRSVDAVTEQIGKAGETKKSLLAELGTALNEPRFAEMLAAQQADKIAAAMKAGRDQMTKLKPPRPVLQETIRLLRALEGFEEVRLVEYDVNAVVASATLTVPDADTGPEILEELRRNKKGVLQWDGTTQASFRADGKRQYRLTATWPN